jgi:hypothetical protein
MQNHKLLLVVTAIATLVLGALPAASQNLTTIELLPSLTTYVNLIPGPSGSFYGVSSGGGLARCSEGCGNVFQLTPSSGGGWTQTILHTFTGADGVWPQTGLLLDHAGNLYGTTFYGGSSSEGCLGNGCGVVFRLSRDLNGTWTETILYSFTGGADGQSPTGLVFGPSGSLIGTTIYGGSSSCVSPGCGVLFEVSRGSNGKWQEKVLYNFKGGASGQNPKGIVANSSGDIYGAAGGGVIENACGGVYCGTVFEITGSRSGRKASLIHTFHGADGANVNGSLILDSAGNIFGTTQWGGKPCASPGCGVVFELASAKGTWKEAVLYSFANGTDGEYPSDGLAFDAEGNLYGGTSYGGSIENCNPFLDGACGQVFELSSVSGRWRINKEYATPNFYTPVGNLLFDSSGDLFGASCDEVYFNGGNIFEVVK